MRLVFLGSGAFGLPTLRHLREQHDVALVVTQPDRPAGRGGKLRATPIGQWAADETGLDVFKPDRINEPAARDRVRAVEADAWVVIAYGQKLGRRLLDDRFAINLHASLLPRWRGAAPIHHAVMAGDAATGNSVITLADEMDAGDVLGQSERAVGPSQTTGDLHGLLADDGPVLIGRVLQQHKEGALRPVAQDPSRVTQAPKLSREDARLDPAASAERVRAIINGLSPWPGVDAELAGERVRLLRADRAADAGEGAAWTVLDPSEGLVACADGCVRILEIQPIGKRPMDFAAFARGRSIETGTPLRPIQTETG